MRAALAALVLAVVTLVPCQAHAAEKPLFDVDAALQTLTTQQVYTAPGSIATYDRAVVTKALGTTFKLLVAPPRPYLAAFDGDQAVYDQIDDWATAHKVQVIEVTGTQTDLIGTGTATPSDLISARNQLGKDDVTDLITYLIKVAGDPSLAGQPNNTVTPDDGVPAPASTTAPILRAFGRGSSYVAPGLTGAAHDTLPGLTVKVAVLPVAPIGPYPEVLPTLHAAYPHDEVVVVRGHYLEASGPQPDLDSTAADYVLGEFKQFLEGQVVPTDAIVALFLTRYQLLRTGTPFSDKPVYPPGIHRLFHRYAPVTGLIVAVLLAAGSALSVLARRRDAAADDSHRITDYQRRRAAVYASLSTLNAKLVEATHGPQVSRAAERHSEALDLWDQAERDQDPEVLDAAAGAVADADRLLGAAR